MLNKTVNLSLNDLLFLSKQPDQNSSSFTISDALQTTLEFHNIRCGQTVYLPPIMSLAKHFQTNHLKVYDAFQHLRQQGYDYALDGLDNPIPFWQNTNAIK